MYYEPNKEKCTLACGFCRNRYYWPVRRTLEKLGTSTYLNREYRMSKVNNCVNLSSSLTDDAEQVRVSPCPRKSVRIRVQLVRML